MSAASFEGRLCIVTGASSGIGKATAELLSRKGAVVVVADIDSQRGEQTAAHIGGTFTHSNVSDELSVQRAVEGAINEHKIPLHAYINCAGVEGQHGPIEALDVGSFDATLAINLRGTFLGIKHAARAMKEAGVGGAIVNVASIAGVTGGLAPAPYTASKFAVVGLTKQAACELAPHGIRCNAVSPCGVDTPMIRRFMQKPLNESVAEDIQRLQVYPHVCTVEDVAGSIAFLASNEAASITGHNLVVDCAITTGVGGMTLEAFGQMRGKTSASSGA